MSENDGDVRQDNDDDSNDRSYPGEDNAIDSGSGSDIGYEEDSDYDSSDDEPPYGNPPCYFYSDYDYSDDEPPDCNPGYKRKHACWIEKSPDYCAIQTEKTKANENAVKLFDSLIKIIATLEQDDIRCYLRWWLNTATRHNHIELLNLMLAHSDPYYEFWLDDKDEHCNFISPLYIAIEKGDLSLVNTFLVAGARVTFNPRYSFLDHCDADGVPEERPRVHDKSEKKNSHIYVSAVEYACIVNQPEVFKVLVSHYERQYPHQCVQSDFDFNMTFYEISEELSRTTTRVTRRSSRHIHPLHSMMRLATRFYGQHIVALPAFVQLIIDGDRKSVHYIDNHCFTPLQLLLSKVRLLFPLDHVAAEHRRIIVEVVEILLKAGSYVNMTQFKERDRDALVCLLRGTMRCHRTPINRRREKLRHFQVASAYRNNLQLIRDLTRLLLLYGADITKYQFYKKIPIKAFYILNSLSSMVFGHGCFDICNEIMDTLGDILRSVVLAGAKSLSSEDWSKFLDSDYFVNSFVEIVDYSSWPRRSKKLINVILNALDANNLKKLRDMLLVERQRTVEHRSSITSHKFIDAALACVESIDRPYSLQYLACRAINRAMSTRTLAWNESAGLGLPLPRRLQSLILFQ